MNEFSDRPFVAGSLIGTRSFRIDNLGRLTGVIHQTVWTPGVNVGSHVPQRAFGGLFPSGWFTTLNLASSLYGGVIGTVAEPVKGATPEERIEPEHRVGSLRCECGFYAYFDNAGNPYHTPTKGVIRGLIEGYGVVTVGSRGFRAEKAVIKALVIPPKKLELQLFRAVSANYAGIPIFERHREALAAFPLTPPPMPTPDLDLDFWERPS